MLFVLLGGSSFHSRKKQSTNPQEPRRPSLCSCGLVDRFLLLGKKPLIHTNCEFSSRLLTRAKRVSSYSSKCSRFAGSSSGRFCCHYFEFLVLVPRSGAAHQREQCLRRPLTKLLVWPLLFTNREWVQVFERATNASPVFGFKVPQINTDRFSEPREQH